MLKPARASLVYLLINAIEALAGSIMFTVTTVYFVQTIGLNPLQLVLVGTVLEGTILLFEIPTGVIADTFSRRLSIRIGHFIIGFSFLLYGVVMQYWAVLLGQILWGIGYTFTSGATEAWLADEVGEENVGAIYIRSGQIGRIAGLVGTGLSVALASIALNLPLIIGGGLYLLLAVFLLFKMPETHFVPQPRKETLGGHLAGMKHTLMEGLTVVRASPLLITLIAVELVVGAASEGFDRLGDAHLLTNFTFPSLGTLQPVVWFGILNIVGSLIALLVTAVTRQRLEQTTQSTRSTARALLVFNGLSIASVLMFALAGNFYIAIAALLLRGVLGSLIHPLYNSWLVQNISPATRATVVSMVGQSNALGQVAGGPGIGAIGNAFSLRAAIFGAGLLSLPVLYLYARVLRSPSPVTAVPAEAD